MRLASLALVLLAAPAAAAPKLPAHYARMFERDATWTYDLVPGDPVTCKVARTTRIGNVVASEITCDRDGFPIADVYLAEPDGLYRSGTGFPTTKAELGPIVLHAFLIGARPKVGAKKITQYVPGGDRVVTTLGARRERKIWCWYRTTAIGKSAHTDTACFADGIGIVSGNEDGLAYTVR